MDVERWEVAERESERLAHAIGPDMLRTLGAYVLMGMINEPKKRDDELLHHVLGDSAKPPPPPLSVVPERVE